MMKKNIEPLHIENVEWAQFKVSKEALEKITVELAQRHEVFPLKCNKGSLEVAVSEPVDLGNIDTLSHYLGLHLKLKRSSSEKIRQAIATYYDNNFSSSFQEGSLEMRDHFEKDPDKKEGNDKPFLNDYFNRLIDKAIQHRASDIHIEPMTKSLRVRFRIDGTLHEVEQLPLALYPGIANQIKLRGTLDIAEKRLPQDGRIAVRRDHVCFDLRLSSLPTIYGESIVMRLLNAKDLIKGFAALGCNDTQQDLLQKIIQTPHGLVLITGPTGSGKTTTLYTFLQKLNQTRRKIITLEDPIEYVIKGINQVHIQEKTGMTFARALRAILRQSPDVIMIGEIRDQETAEIAINASLTGHLVISTLHTNDAPSAITRLLEMKIPSFLLASALRAIVAQRLIPMLCQHCQAAHHSSTSVTFPDPSINQRLNRSQAKYTEKERLKRVENCVRCTGLGYYGRTGIFEILVIDEALRSLIHEGVALERLHEQALRSGMKPLRESGMRKVAAGLTNIEAIDRITTADRYFEA